MGKFQFGEVYRGNYEGDDVVVKIWKEEKLPGENRGRLEDELSLHEYFSVYEFHPNLAKLRHLCRGPKNLAALYYLNPIAIDTLHNLIEKDTFTWALRIKVAFGIASLLRYMHSPHPNCPSDVPYLIRNIDAAHILVDQDYEALLFDFSMISGGILTDKRELLNQYIQGSCGYSDPNCTRTGKWSDSCDIFSYGVVLLSLISKRVYKDDGDSTDAPFVYVWAKNEHKQQNSVASGKFKSWLVHDSLKSDPYFNFDDAVTITNLAMRCVKDNPQQRPTMKQVVRQMLNLHIVKQNANTWECCRMLDAVNKIHQSRRLPKDNRVKLYRQPSRWHRGILINRFNDRMCNRTIKGLGQSQARVKVFSCKALIKATDSFSEENLIGKYQFGKVFRGEIKGQKVTVKIWETIVDKGVY
ncbi:probable serine/threonine-protein kinase PBL28 isoform X1 [Euphorbia lathyris]|uniref:probable serine/threonine-protein kinase PBL28 isoform X1 n=1 Tax=Euphorbia lathyris TaxID=212925 RepID=UPI0033136624